MSNNNYNNKFNLLFLICTINLLLSLMTLSQAGKLARFFELPAFGTDASLDNTVGSFLVALIIVLAGKSLYDFIKTLVKGEK